MTKKEASARLTMRLTIIASEIRLTLDESDDDCPTWADDLAEIADSLLDDAWRK